MKDNTNQKLKTRNHHKPIYMDRMFNQVFYPIKKYVFDEAKQHFGIDVRITQYDEIRKAYLWLFNIDRNKMWNRLTFANGDMIRYGREQLMTKNLTLSDVINFDIHEGYFYVKISCNTYIFIHKENNTHNSCHTEFNTLYIYFFGKGAYTEFLKFKEFVNNADFPNGYLNYDNGMINYDHEIINRSKSTVYMKNKDEFIDNVKKLKDISDILSKKGITFSPGILLYGKPGCGKSTIITMLASELNADIVAIKFIGLEKAIKEITNFKHNNPGKTIIVTMEDIDMLFQNRDNCNNVAQKVSLNTLFQFLDGSLTIPGIIVIATTNYIDKLDPALIRDGRFDIKLEIKELDKDLAKEMCDTFGMSYDILEDEQFPINPAYLQGKILKKIKSDALKENVKK